MYEYKNRKRIAEAILGISLRLVESARPQLHDQLAVDLEAERLGSSEFWLEASVFLWVFPLHLLMEGYGYFQHHGGKNLIAPLSFTYIDILRETLRHNGVDEHEVANLVNAIPEALSDYERVVSGDSSYKTYMKISAVGARRLAGTDDESEGIALLLAPFFMAHLNDLRSALGELESALNEYGIRAVTDPTTWMS